MAKRKKYLQEIIVLLFSLFLLGLSAVWLSDVLYRKSSAARLSLLDLQSDSFRKQSMTEDGLRDMAGMVKGSGIQISDYMVLRSTVMKGKKGQDCDIRAWMKWKYIMLKENREGYERISNAYGAIWDDLEYFPVDGKPIYFENTWMFERYYGGKRGHEGTDLIPEENIPNYYPVVSMTDGIVEKIGWLPQGGYRIGIRSPSGGYFYYAHLSNYYQDFEVGDLVYAGDVLGTMGDTGYGEEGTTGKFDVHLHVGIYIKTENFSELSVNPYWALRYLQESSKGSVASSQ